MKRPMLLLAGLLFWLPACGGGGGGGLPAATLPITTHNALAVAQSVLGGGTGLEDISSGVEEILNQLALDQDGTFPCPIDGTYTVNSGTTSGSIQFNDCVFDFNGQETTFNGSLSVRQVNQSTIAITFNLVVDSPGDTTSITGGMNVQIRTVGVDTIETIISGSKLTVTSNGESVSLENYRLAETANLATGAYSVTQRGTIRDNVLGGTVNFSTPTPITGIGNAEPTAGVIRIDGANGSIITATISGPDVFVEVDEDGDGTPEDSFTTTWAALTD